MNRRILFPTSERHGLLAKRDAHLGVADSYTIVEIDPGGNVKDVSILANEQTGKKNCRAVYEKIAALKADTLVVSRIGKRSLAALVEQGIDVFHDALSGNVYTALHAYTSNRLAPLHLQPKHH